MEGEDGWDEMENWEGEEEDGLREGRNLRRTEGGMRTGRGQEKLARDLFCVKRASASSHDPQVVCKLQRRVLANGKE